MKKEKVLKIAAAHIQELNSKNTLPNSYNYTLSQELKEYQDYWYFDYEITSIHKLNRDIQK